MQAFQGAIAIVRKFGKPDLFITFTANPAWEEITSELNVQPYTNRPDICVRVLNSKLFFLNKNYFFLIFYLNFIFFKTKNTKKNVSHR